MANAVLKLTDVRLVRDGHTILEALDWTVYRDQRWIVLGPNGSGKTTLCRIASLYQHPSSGSVEVLGGRLGEVDVRELRTRVGLTSAALIDMLRPTLPVADIVATGKYAALAPWWHRYDEADRERARALLGRFGGGHLADRRLGTLSSGERQRVLLARTLMSDPELLLLDEPTAGLDLGGREELVSMLAALASDRHAPPSVFVTHHVDEIPPGYTHVLMMAAGRVLAAGPLDETLTAHQLSRCFGLPLQLARQDGRWVAWKRTD
jgi:iron complex transport system ATP-binding protein